MQDPLALVSGFLGGLGLFLLGMWLMTEGLKLAAGRALERILAAWTRGRLRGLATGTLVTALVQSSSATTVAAIGFVNAGLLSFAQVVWVIFGANVGTTMTGWLVALIGLNIKIEAFALPFLGAGMLLRLTGEGTRRGAVGTAMAGFGALFLGIDVLKDTFTGLGQEFQLGGLEGLGILATVGYVLAGVLLTVLMQSSSAAIAIALTAAASGMLALSGAAAVVIGANVGTTVTALLAVIGATSNARRAAAAHVLFNLLTGVVALLLLPWLLQLIAFLATEGGGTTAPATLLALFHTTFNVLGVLLMWPISDRMVRFLEDRFRTAEEDEARPRHLDANVVSVPALAMDALRLELQRLGGLALRMARKGMGEGLGRSALTRDQTIVARLTHAIGEFAVRLHGARMTPRTAARLPEILRVARYYDAIAELVASHAALPPPVGTGVAAQAPQDSFRQSVTRVFDLADSGREGFESEALAVALAHMQETYQAFKAALLEAGAAGGMSVSDMEIRLQQASLTRRVAEQSAKAAQRLHALRPRGTGPETLDPDAALEAADAPD